MSNKIVPLRPRDQVARRIESGPTTPVNERISVRINQETGICRLLRGLATVGLTARFDESTWEVVIEDDARTPKVTP